MRGHSGSLAAVAAISVLLGGPLLAACAPAGTPKVTPLRPPAFGGDADVDAFTIGIGTDIAGDLKEVTVDAAVTQWLNAIDGPGSSDPPLPAADAWQSFQMPVVADYIVFDTGRETSFDVLELLTYPEGLDPSGRPITVEITPLCGPQAEATCANASSGPTRVHIARDLVEQALDGVDYYAIGGIMLPQTDDHPDSFMALLRTGAASN